MTDGNHRRPGTRDNNGLDDEARERAREHLRQRQQAEGRQSGPAHAAGREKHADARPQARSATDMAARAAAGARYTADMASTLPKSALAIAAAVVIVDRRIRRLPMHPSRK